MAETHRGSLTQTVVSLVTAVVALGLASGVCVAGDKIEFTMPGNPILQQKPDSEKKAEDDQGAVKFDSGGQASSFSEFSLPEQQAGSTFVIQNNRKDRNNKRNGLRAWDSGLKPFERDRDDLTDSDNKPPSDGVSTNRYDAKSDWDKEKDKQDKRESPSGFARVQDRERDDKATAFSGERRRGQDGDQNRGGIGANLLPGLGKDDESSKDDLDSANGKDSQTTLSAWGKTLASPKESYAERFEQYRSMYNASSVSAAGADGYSKSGLNDSSDLSPSAMEDIWGAKSAASTGFDALGSAWDSTSAAVSRFSQPTATTSPASDYQALAPTVAAPSANFRPMAAQPAILSFPKQPGSVFQ